MRLPFALLIPALLAAACGGEGGMSDADAAPIVTSAVLLAGVAATDGSGFFEVEDGEDAELVPGSQGGFHVWVNLQLKGAKGELRLEREARRVSDEKLVLRASPQSIEVPDDAMEDFWESPRGAPAFMCPTPLGVQIRDEAIRITLRLRDDDEELLGEDSIVVTPRCPAEEQHDFCIEICSG